MLAIPFAFVTGYSPDDVLPLEQADVPVLASDPYGGNTPAIVKVGLANEEGFPHEEGA